LGVGLSSDRLEKTFLENDSKKATRLQFRESAHHHRPLATFPGGGKSLVNGIAFSTSTPTRDDCPLPWGFLPTDPPGGQTAGLFLQSPADWKLTGNTLATQKQSAFRRIRKNSPDVNVRGGAEGWKKPLKRIALSMSNPTGDDCPLPWRFLPADPPGGQTAGLFLQSPADWKLTGNTLATQKQSAFRRIRKNSPDVNVRGGAEKVEKATETASPSARATQPVTIVRYPGVFSLPPARWSNHRAIPTKPCGLEIDRQHPRHAKTIRLQADS
jgi:hypothetical protein